MCRAYFEKKRENWKWRKPELHMAIGHTLHTTRKQPENPGDNAAAKKWAYGVLRRLLGCAIPWEASL